MMRSALATSGALVSCAIVLMVAACGVGSDGADQPSAATSSAPAGPGATTTDGPGVFQAGEYRLHAECAGTGSPTVVFLHGLGGVGSDWAATAELLQGAHTCWYDRLNVGLSDGEEARHSALDSVEDLHALLSEMEADPPYLLMGHSYGGMLALMYGGRYPDEVSGMVLADGTLPLETTLDPPETVTAVKAEMDENGENLDAYAGYAAARRLERALPDVPITYVLAVAQLEQALPPEWSVSAYQRKLRAWVSGLAVGRLVECDCSHAIPREAPARVAHEVRRILGR